MLLLIVASTPVFLFLAHYLTGIIAMGIVMQRASSPEGMIAPLIGISTALAVLLMGVAAELFYRRSSEIVLRLTNARPLDPTEEPMLATILENLCIGAGLPRPRLAIIESAATNLYSTGMEPENSALVVTRGLLDVLDRQELEGVIAQELSQIGNGDVQLGTVLATLVTLMSVPFSIVGGILRVFFGIGRGCGIVALGFMIYLGLMLVGALVFVIGMSDEMFENLTTRIVFVAAMLFPIYALFVGPAAGFLLRSSVSREREYLADADAVLLTRYPPGLARALIKIGVPGNATIDARPSIAHLWIADPRDPNLGPRSDFFETHPPIDERIDALVRMGGTTPEMIAEAERAGRDYKETVLGENNID